MNKTQYALNTLLIIALGAGLFMLYTNREEINEINSLARVESQTSPQRLFLESWKITKNKYYDKNLNEQNWHYWKNHYLKSIKTEEDAYIAINSMLESLNDPYSRFLNEQEFKEQNIDMDAKITGIGVNMTMVSGKAIIVGVIDDAPAKAADLRTGDIILKVDGVDMSGKNIADIAQSIRGEVNTYVTLELLRDEKKITKKLQRKEVKIQSVRAKLIDDSIGYIRISTFMSNQMGKEFADALKKVENAKGIIIDLRNNTGGIFNNAITLSNAFINQGTIVSIHNRQGQEYSIDASPNQPCLTVPTVILVNQGSASASEIFSGAMKDSKRAILVGERTFGKSAVQKIFNLPNNTGMNITVAKYLTPSGADISKKGIDPDYEVKLSDMWSSKDEQLDKAVEILKSQI